MSKLFKRKVSNNENLRDLRHTCRNIGKLDP